MGGRAKKFELFLHIGNWKNWENFEKIIYIGNLLVVGEDEFWKIWILFCKKD